MEEFETHLKDEEGRCDKAQTKVEKSSKILVDAKSGVDHLTEKLKHLKVVRTLSSLSNVHAVFAMFLTAAFMMF